MEMSKATMKQADFQHAQATPCCRSMWLSYSWACGQLTKLWGSHSCMMAGRLCIECLQIGQELEDVLAERDALKLVNQELAKRVTQPDSSGPCKGCMQVCENT